MLRMIFVLVIMTFGVGASLFSPFYALLFYLWNAYFRPDEWTYGGFITSLNLSWIIGAYLLLATAVSLPRMRVNTRTILLALFFADSLFSAYHSEHLSWSWNAWIDFSKVLVITYLIVLLATDRVRYRAVLTVIAVSLGFECAKQGWAQLYVAPGAQNNNTIAFLGDNNGVAVGTMMLVPVLGALAQTATRKWETYLHRFLLIGVFMRGITTYSRGGFLAASVLGVFSLIRSPRKVRTLIGIGAIVLIVTTIMPQQFWDRMNTINAEQDERDDSAAGRVHFWTVAMIMADAKPLTGVGFNGFSQSYESYNGPSEFAGQRAVHSVWFGLLADMGYPGLTLFLLLLTSSLWSCWRVSVNCKKDPDQRDLRIYANALFTSLVTFAAGGTFLSAQYNEMVWHFIGLTTTLSFLAEEARDPAAAREPQVVMQPAFVGAFRSTPSK
jgi:probable O-glycosylation ligase (exosortase A-associated)